MLRPVYLGVVVAEVGWDDGAGADEVVLLVEHEAGPGELPGAGLSMGQPASRGVPGPRQNKYYNAGIDKYHT